MGYCDADWAGSTEDRKSTSSYCVLLNKTAPVYLGNAESNQQLLYPAAKLNVLLFHPLYKRHSC